VALKIEELEVGIKSWRRWGKVVESSSLPTHWHLTDWKFPEDFWWQKESIYIVAGRQPREGKTQTVKKHTQPPPPHSAINFSQDGKVATTLSWRVKILPQMEHHKSLLLQLAPNMCNLMRARAFFLYSSFIRITHFYGKAFSDFAETHQAAHQIFK